MRRLTFNEHLLRYMKRTKRRTDQHSVLLAIFLGIVLMFTSCVDSKFIQTADMVPLETNDHVTTFGFTGDIMLGRHVKKTIQRHDPIIAFSGTGIDLTSLDYLTGNFEHPIVDDEIKVEDKKRDKIYLSTEEEMLTGIKQAGFTNINLANNHMYDFGEEGIIHTIETLNQFDVPFVGAGKNRSEAYDIHYEEINDQKVATLGFTEVYTRDALTGIETPGVATSNMNMMLNKVHEARKFADLVVVHLHWGTEYKTKFDKRQQQIAEILADAGVDVILGHHPHVLQTVDVIDDTIVFYSLGNFIFDQGWSMTRETVFPVLTLAQDGQVEVELTPLLIKQGVPQRLKKTEGYFKKRIFNRLKQKSSINFIEEDDKLKFTTQFKRETIEE